MVRWNIFTLWSQSRVQSIILLTLSCNNYMRTGLYRGALSCVGGKERIDMVAVLPSLQGVSTVLSNGHCDFSRCQRNRILDET